MAAASAHWWMPFCLAPSQVRSGAVPFAQSDRKFLQKVGAPVSLLALILRPFLSRLDAAELLDDDWVCCELGITTAFEEMNVPPILTPEDMANKHLDELR